MQFGQNISCLDGYHHYCCCYCCLFMIWIFSCSNFEVTHWTRNWGQKMTYFDLMTNLQMASSHILLIAINSYFNLCSKSYPFYLLTYLLFESMVIFLHIKNHWLDSQLIFTKNPGRHGASFNCEEPDCFLISALTISSSRWRSKKIFILWW